MTIKTTDLSPQYIIDDWTVGHELNEKTGRNVTKVTMILSRKITSIFMETYLPTILMNMINQATNYISGDTKDDLIYTINITCMMVLASVYLSVSASLPSTANIKPVEVWLLFNLAFPALVIIVNVLLQVSLSFSISENLLYIICLLSGFREETTREKEAMSF